MRPSRTTRTARGSSRSVNGSWSTRRGASSRWPTRRRPNSTDRVGTSASILRWKRNFGSCSMSPPTPVPRSSWRAMPIRRSASRSSSRRLAKPSTAARLRPSTSESIQAVAERPDARRYEVDLRTSLGDGAPGPDRPLPGQETDAEGADEDQRQVIAVEIDAQLGKDDRALGTDHRQRQEVTHRQSADQRQPGEQAKPGHRDRDVDPDTGPILVEGAAGRRDDPLARGIGALKILPGALERLGTGVDGGGGPDAGLVLHLVLPKIEECPRASDRVGPEVGVGDDEGREGHRRQGDEHPAEAVLWKLV